VAGACTHSGWPALVPGSLGLLVLGGTLFERVRYRPLQDTAPGPGWTDTGERFVDPTTGDHVAVFFNPVNGDRQYVRHRR
jgi:hypothetical protein